MPRRASWTIVALTAAFGVAVASTQTTSIFLSRTIRRFRTDAADTRRRRQAEQSLEKGSVTLEFDPLPRGYLASVLKAFDITPASQTLVFSENSLQRDYISKQTPRAVYFNDSVAVGWAKGADTIEATVLDSTQGVQSTQLASETAGAASSLAAPTACSAISCRRRTVFLAC